MCWKNWPARFAADGWASIRAMGLVLSATVALCAWIVLWAIGASGFDGMLLVVGVVVFAIAVRTLLPFLPGRRD
jgi:hypothetical protein